jgi:hypothetical protein
MDKVEVARKESMDRVLARFYADLESSDVVPHVGDLKVKDEIQTSDLST